MCIIYCIAFCNYKIIMIKVQLCIMLYYWYNILQVYAYIATSIYNVQIIYIMINYLYIVALLIFVVC